MDKAIREGNLSFSAPGIEVSTGSTATPTVTPESADGGITVPGAGNADDLSQGLNYAKIVVLDLHPANAQGYWDRTIYNTADPTQLDLPKEFLLPEGWTVERDMPESTMNFVSYWTVKPDPNESVENINSDVKMWATQNKLSESQFIVTSVVSRNGQECSLIGLPTAEKIIRVNVYLDYSNNQTWIFQACK
jgi:hypothetical protein